ncbi:MAG TPA: LytTR family DNA-binding domain-containing protein [Caulobacteraceae bacterium]|nr:LytTR family DNA-binding domain-containing protein [Caulobacteraceae bacterium]
MNRLRAIIIDDEPLAVRRLEQALAPIEGVEVVGSAPDGNRGLELVRSLSPELVFLDVQMPGLDGLDVAQALDGDAQPSVVFVTAYAHHAVEAFELAAVDYLLKPIEFDRVAAAVTRVRQRRAESSALERAAYLQTLVAAIRDPGPQPAETDGLRHVWVADTRGRVRVELDTVEWVEAERDYVRLHTPGRAYLLRGTLQGLADRLDPAAFFRVHRSAVVNLAAVTGLRRRLSGSAVVQLASGGDVPVGRAYLKDLKARLGLASRGDLEDETLA